MGSMVIFHYLAGNPIDTDEMMNVMMPMRFADYARADYFNQLMLDGKYVPAYVIQSDDLAVAFDCGNGYVPKGTECLELTNASHKSTSVGDIVVVNGTRKMLVMPVGFEEI